MQIYNGEVMQALWDIISPLEAEIPVYKETFTEDSNSTPESYILLISDVTNEGNIYGDGTAKTRTHDCDIHLISKGIADRSNDLHNINRAKIEALLKEQNINYTGVNLGYDPTQKRTEYNFSIEVTIYG